MSGFIPGTPAPPPRPRPNSLFLNSRRTDGGDHNLTGRRRIKAGWFGLTYAEVEIHVKDDGADGTRWKRATADDLGRIQNWIYSGGESPWL